MNNPMDKRGIPNRVQRYHPPRSTATPKDARRRELRQFPESWQQSVGLCLQMECNPHFCPAIFWGPQPDH